MMYTIEYSKDADKTLRKWKKSNPRLFKKATKSFTVYPIHLLCMNANNEKAQTKILPFYHFTFLPFARKTMKGRITATLHFVLNKNMFYFQKNFSLEFRV